MKKNYCSNSDCNKRLTKSEIIDSEELDYMYKDLDNGESYDEKEQIPSGHEYEKYTRVSYIYECSSCETETEIEEIIKG
jgi:hypothetical protein